MKNLKINYEWFGKNKRFISLIVATVLGFSGCSVSSLSDKEKYSCNDIETLSLNDFITEGLEKHNDYLVATIQMKNGEIKKDIVCYNGVDNKFDVYQGVLDKSKYLDIGLIDYNNSKYETKEEYNGIVIDKTPFICYMDSDEIGKGITVSLTQKDMSNLIDKIGLSNECNITKNVTDETQDNILVDKKYIESLEWYKNSYVVTIKKQNGDMFHDIVYYGGNMADTGDEVYEGIISYARYTTTDYIVNETDNTNYNMYMGVITDGIPVINYMSEEEKEKAENNVISAEEVSDIINSIGVFDNQCNNISYNYSGKTLKFIKR